MTLSESNQLINALRKEYFRAFGVQTGALRFVGVLMSHCAFLLADEAIKEIVKSNIQKEINHLKTLPDYDS